VLGFFGITDVRFVRAEGCSLAMGEARHQQHTRALAAQGCDSGNTTEALTIHGPVSTAPPPDGRTSKPSPGGNCAAKASCRARCEQPSTMVGVGYVQT
jgi:hypothetical protein